MLILLISISQVTFAAQEAETRVKTIELKSAIAQQTLTLTVIVPEGYQADSKQRYPVFYTQTDPRRLKLIQQQIDWLSHLDFGPIPKMLIVSLPNISLNQHHQHKDAKASGLDTPLTIKVLAQEILPYIDREFRSQPFKILEGYSTQANLPLGILAQQPNLFNAYISINPALVLDKSELLKQLKARLSSKALAHRSLYVSLGNFVQNKPLFEQLQVILTTQKTLLNWQLSDLSSINYYTTPVTALPQALEQLFSDRQPQDIEQFLVKGLPDVEQYFKRLAHKYGYELSQNSTLLALGQLQMQQQQFSGALATFERLNTLKPNSIYYLTLLARAQHKNQRHTASKQSLELALELAQASKHQGEINFVKSQIAKLFP